jgi:hypothetical protein
MLHLNDISDNISPEIMPQPHPRGRPLAEGDVVTKAVLRAAGRRGCSNKSLARILGLSEASISRMGSGTYALAPGDKAFEVSLLFLRLFRALDAIVAGDEAAARTWLRQENTVLGGAPGEMIESLAGLVTVVGYLDARRALI